MRKIFILLLLHLPFLHLCISNAFGQCSVEAGNNVTICSGQSTTLTAVVTGGTPTTYTWASIPAGVLPSTSAITVSPTVTTSYIVSVSGNGCSSSDTVIVSVNPKPTVPAITFSPNNVCSGTAVGFSTPVQAGVTFSWNFGDGTTGTGLSITHQFTSYGTGSGTFTVTLTATNASGCTSTSTQVVTVKQKPIAGLAPGSGVDTFTSLGTLYFYKCVSTTAQSSNFNFVNISNPNSGVTSTIIWGDTGANYTTSGTWTNVSHIYARGKFTLTYIVTNTGDGCPDTIQYAIFFGSNPAGGIASLGSTDICGPTTLAFALTNWQTNPPGTTYTIVFNDGSPSLNFTQPPPDTIVHLFSIASCDTTSSNGTTTFNNAFSATLTISNPCGVTAGAVVPIYVSLSPVADFVVTGGDTVCQNVVTTITNTTTDGETADSHGCNNSSPILWSITPAAGWTRNSGSFGSDNGFTGVNFDPTSWTSGSNTLGVTFSAAGTYQVQLVAGTPCGADTIIKTICVTPKPAPSFTLSPNSGCAPFTVTVNNTTPALNSCGLPVYVWSVVQTSFTCNPLFGNDYTYIGGTNANSVSPTIEFNNQGIYNVELFAENACGSYTAGPETVTVKIAPQAAVTAPSLICAGTSITPVAVTLPCAGTISAYSWTFQGGTPATSTSQTPGSINFATTGSHTVTLAVTNECGTTDANTVVVIDTAPVAVVGPPAQLCSGSSITIGGAAVPGLTYSWSPGTGLSSTTVSDPTVTLTNNGTTPVTTTYYLTVTNTQGCTGTDSVQVTVYPKATVNAGAPASVCAGGSITLTGTIGGSATSATWSSPSGTFNPTNTLTTVFTPTITSGAAVVTLTTNVPSAYCPAASATVTITVKPVPTVTASPIHQTICSGSSTAGISLTSGVGGTTFAWTGSSPDGITGFIASGNTASIPSQTLTNPNSTQGIVVYVITPTAAGCPGPPVNDTIYVNPSPKVNPVGDQTICSGGTSVVVTFSSSTAGTTFSWTGVSSGNLTGYTASQLGNIPAQTITNTGTVIDSVVYTVTPTANGCTGPTIKTAIIVDPTPTVTLPAPQTICSGATSTVATLTSSTPGTTFSWTASATAGITGFTASGTGNIPAQTISNSGTTQGTVTYTITPTANGCPGPNSNYEITINPVPIATATPSPDTICSATQTNIALTSSVAGTTFSWTFTEPGSVTGAANGTGSSILQTLTNSSSSPQTVSYTITPKANGCNGPPIIVNVVVNPTITIQFTPGNQTICSGQSTTLVNISSTTAGATFAWTSAANGIGGVTASGTNTIPVQTLTNAGNTSLTAVYTVTTSFGGCPSPAATYDITVNPIPHVILPAFQTICSGTATSTITLSSNVAGTTYSWTGSSPDGITGFTASGTTATIPSQTLTNSGTTQGIVLYVITPTAATCPGAVANDTIYVNPLPKVNPVADQTICSGGTSTAVTPSSATAGTTFSWIGVSSGNLTGYTAGGSGNIPAQTINNTGAVIDSLVYTVTPTANGCTGPAIKTAIVVDPTPAVTLPAPQTICSGATSTVATLTSSTPGTTFSWTASAAAGITGFTASGTGNIPAQTISNSGTTQGTVTYTVTPTANGCPGPNSNYVITINPVPIATATPSPDTICTATQTNIALTSNVTGTTYTWTITEPGSVTGAANGSGSSILQTLTNSSSSPQTVSYTITPKANGCNGPPIVENVVVNPTITIQFTPGNQTICSGQSTTLVNISSTTAGATFAWTSAANGIGGVTASGTNTIPVQTLTNGGNTSLTAVYTVTTSFGGCPSPAATYNITVNPIPHVILPTFQTTCSGTATSAITLTSNVVGTTYSWTGSSPDGITGFTASGTTATISSQTLTNPSTTQGIVVYVITPTAATCPGAAANDTIYVNPLPKVNPVADQTICSGGTSIAVTLSSATAGTTFSWIGASSGNLTGYTASGSGNIPAQTITNTGAVIDSLVYTVTPTANGCTGPTIKTAIIVDPTPAVTLPAPQTICSGATSTVATLTSSTPGTTFSWTASATAGITGFTASGTGNIPAQTISNSSTTQGTVTYTITPTANGCPGPNSNYLITINPVPIATATPSPDTICSATQTNIALTSSVAGTTFSWTFTEPGSVTGAANGNGSSILQTLTSSSSNLQTVSYYITPKANGCNGKPDTVNVVVIPTVIIQFTPGNQTICSGQTTTLVNITSTTAGATFAWTSAANGVGGVTTSGSNTIPAQTLTNPGNSSLTAVYTVTTSFGGCPGPAANYNITVNPIPHVILPAFQTICSGTATSTITLSSNVAGTTYNWTGSSPDGITGFTANGGTSSIPSQTLTNPSTTQGIVVYVISPTAATCPGPAANDTNYVNPSPIISPVSDQTICNGGTSIVVTLSSTTAGTTFSWIGASSGNLTGYTAGGSGNIPVQTITNTGAVIDSLVYTVTPTANGCTGPAIKTAIVVDPTPAVNLPAPQTICSGATSAVATLTSSTPGTTFIWSASATAGITGFTASGSGNIPAQTISNSGTTQGTVTYTITPSANGCPGPNSNYVITINPVAIVAASPSPDTICTATQTNITLTSNVTGTTYSWTFSAPGSITGAANGSGNAIQQVLNNSSANPQTVSYFITPRANGCNGTPATVNVVVGPTLTIQLPANQAICSGQSTMAVGITSPTAGVVFSWVSAANGIAGVAVSGTDSIPVQTLINSGNSPVAVVYTVTATYSTCPSQTANYDITVHPIPQVILPAFQTICSATATSAINLISNVAGTTYSWTGSSPDGVTGFTVSGTTNSIAAQTLTNPAVTPGIVVYVITPSAATCPGAPVNDTITVNPLPAINALTPQTICSGAASSAVTLGSSTAGTTYSWTAGSSGNITGYASSGSGNIPAQTIANSGTAIDSAVFVITPRANGCNGPAVHYDIIVDPLPVVILPAPQSICSGTATTTVALSSATAGTTFSWTASATAGITGYTASGTGNIPAQTMSNPGNVSGTVTFVIAPSANGCPGPNSNYVVTVKPIPLAISTPAIDTICPSAQTNISITSNVAGTTFSWVVHAPASITGGSNGSGNVIQQVLSNSNVNPQTVLYVITPSASTCPGLQDTATVVVHPGVAIQFSLGNQTICTGQTTQALAISSTSPNVTFSWTSQANGIGGVTAAGATSIPAQVLTNNSNGGLTAAYTVIAGYAGCPAVSSIYDITVNPAPHVILPTDQTVCSGTATQNIAIGSNVAGTTFIWMGSSPDGVTGFVANGSTANIPSQTLSDPAATAGMVIYSITPSATGCPGLFLFDTITVNPLPLINPLTPQTICSGATSTQVNLSSPTAGTTYTWTATSVSLTGYNTNGAGNIPPQTIINPGTAIDSVVFTITPLASGCNGPVVKYAIVVDPLPVVILPAPQSICSDASTLLVTLNSATAGTTYSWTATGTAGIIGFTASGTGNIPPQIISNPGNTAGTVTYFIIPSANGCTGPSSNYIVTVKPLPVASATPSPDTICPSTQTNITITSTVSGTTFSWTYNEPGSVTGAANGTGAFIQQVLSNSSVNPQTVFYFINPLAAGCNGPLDTTDVVVHPGVGIQFSAGPQTICSGQSTQAVVITSLSPNVNFQWTSQANGVSGVAVSGTDSIPVQTLVNSGVVPLTVTYTATAGYPGCPIQTSAYNVLVNPTPAVLLPPAQTICSGTATQNIAITSNVAGTTFTWTGASPDGVTGFAVSGSTSNIPSETLSNTSSDPEIVIYSITPGASGCPGIVVNDTITVNPLPVINLLTPQTICSAASSAVVNFSSATTGTSYSWTAFSDSLTGFSRSGSGNIPSQIITNGGTTIDSVVFSITPEANGCNGPHSVYVITVNPVPNVILPPNQVICGNQTTNAVNLASEVSGTTFAWAANATPDITGYMPAGTGNIPSQTISNSGNISGNVTYVITPTANVCPGIIADYVVTVKPLPVITATPAPDTICPSTEVNIALSSSIPGTIITWVISQPAAINGGTNGSGPSIQQILSNSSSNPQTVLYIIADSVNGCRGLPDTVDVDVLPGVGLQLSAAPQIICSGQSTEPVAITSSSPGVTFSWVSQANGITGVAASGTDSIPVQTLMNSGNFGLTADYYITAGYPGCPTTTTAYSIAVNPAPDVMLPPAQTMCSGTASQVISLISNVAGTTFTWTGSSPDGVNGFTPSGNTTIIPSAILSNASDSNGIVVYIINPSSSACPGIAVSDTITVKPLPFINPLTGQTICSGSTGAAVSLSSTTTGTTYSWSVVYNGNISGFTATGSGDITAQTLTNNGSAIDSVVYRIVPNANGCDGPAVDYALVVNPVPDVILPGSQNICSGSSTAVAALTSDIAGTTFSWTGTATQGIGGFTALGTGNIPVQTLTDSNNVDGTVTYSVTTAANGCPGNPGNYIVTVKPVPVASATPAMDTICPSTQTNVAITSNVAGTTFTWTATEPGSVTGASNGAGASILQILSNSSQNPQTVLYIITPKANGCIGLPDSVSVLIQPGVAIQFSTGIQTICSGQTTQAVAITSPSPGVVFSWTSQANGITGVASSGTDSIPAQTLENSTNAALAVAYNIIAGYGSCPDIPESYEVVVNPSPVALLPPFQTICSGGASQSIPISSSVAGTTFSWTGSSPNGVTGFAAAGNTSLIPSEILTDPAITAGLVIYAILPSSTGCPGVVVNDTITVNPLPAINPLTAQTICSGGTSTTVNLSSSTAGATYNWDVTYNGNETGFTSSGTGNIPPQTITNNGSAIDSVVFTITASASGCPGPPLSYDVIVDPTPEVILPTPQTICSGATTTVAVLSSATAGTTYSWAASATAGVTGYTVSGAGNIPAQTLSIAGAVFGTVTYSVAPSANGCPGPVASYIITVKPLPSVNATPAIDTICPSTQTNIMLSSPVAGTSFSWTATVPVNITGASGGTGDAIQQVLSNNGPVPLTVSYNITPEANACFGPPDTVLVTVNPGVNIQYTPANQTICSGQNTQAVSITSTSPGVTFTWTSQANGVSGVAASGTDSIPVQTLVNSSSSALTVDYNVIAGYNGCPGFSSSYGIVVNPTPNVSLPPFQTVCSGAATQIIPISADVSGTTFTWMGSSPGGITGFTLNGSSSDIPSQTLLNSSVIAGIVVYAITPASSGCPGPAVNDTITVNPIPLVNPLSPQTICSAGTSAVVNLSSATAGTTYSWVVGYNGNLTGFTPNGSGNIPAQTITDNGTSTDSVVFTVTPTASGCNGPAADYDIIVNPSPQVILPGPQAICSGATTSVVNLNSGVVGTTYSWAATATGGITGYTINGTGNIPAQTLFNASNVPGTVTYAITGTANTCPGPPANYIITVKPLPVASAVPSPDTICAASQTNINISSTVTGTSFTWTVNAPPAITGAADGTGSLIQQILSNSNPSSQTVVYMITPTANACVGPPDSVNVVVNPGAAIQFTPADQTVCSGQATQMVTISSPASGATFTWTAQANGVTGVATTGTDIIPVQTLGNAGNTADTVVYTVTSVYFSCPGQTAAYFIAVRPIPQDILPPAQTVCSETPSAAVALSSTVAGTAFAWTGSTGSGITGFISNGTGSPIPAQTLVNPANTPGTVAFNITPTADGCPGPASNYIITVNPLPDVILPPVQEICNGTATNAVPLTSDVTGTAFSWTSSAGAGLTGNIPSGSGNIPVQTLTNSGTLQDTLTFVIVPTAANCPGPAVDYYLMVNPTPEVIFPAPQTICSGQTSLPVTITSATPGVNIAWTAVVPNGITGAGPTSGLNTIPPQTLFNTLLDTFPRPQSIIYTAQATTSGVVCPGIPANYSISVEPVPVVGFNESVNNGCSPLNVAFIPGTMNYGIPDTLVFNWGDGSANTTLYPSGVSPLWYPVNHVFYNDSTIPLTYTITLIAHNACIDTTVINTVTVLPNRISAFFTAQPTTGCEPLTVTLHDFSTGPGTLTWCFNYNLQNDSCMGPGEVDTAGSVINYTFNAGVYTVALYVTNGFGCAHDSAYQTITVTPAPEANFAYVNQPCGVSPVSFTDSSTAPNGSTIVAYNWNFGDNATSLQRDPEHAYAAAGTYNACLAVSTTFGCSDSMCRQVIVLSKPQVNFESMDTCLNKQPTQFINTSVAANTYAWNFGDGNTSDLVNPAHDFSAVGTYFVTLIGFGINCSDTITQPVAVNPVPYAAFTVPVQYTCGVPVNIQMTNNSTGALGYFWDFGNGTTSTDNNPVATYTSQADYTISLSASNLYGCYDTAMNSVHIYAYPDVQSIDVSPAEGCQPVEVNFNANATNASHFVWNFGDGTSYSSDSPFTSHLYTDTGTYSVVLYVYSYSACGDTFMLPDTVIVHVNPVAAFDYSQNETVEPVIGDVQFVNNSLNSTSYLWYFGDGDTSTLTDPSHTYTGIEHYDVTLIASTPYGCKDTAIKDIFVIKKSLYVPNAFAPEFTTGNNLVQEWKPAGMGLSEYHAQIFDKWGELLWESTAITQDEMRSPAEGWNGMYRGVLCQQDVYVWKIDATFIDGSRWTGTTYYSKLKKTIGDVTLIR